MIDLCIDLSEVRVAVLEFDTVVPWGLLQGELKVLASFILEN